MTLWDILQANFTDEELVTVLRVAQAALADPNARETVAKQIGLGADDGWWILSNLTDTIHGAETEEE